MMYNIWYDMSTIIVKLFIFRIGYYSTLSTSQAAVKHTCETWDMPITEKSNDIIFYVCQTPYWKKEVI